MEFAGLWVGRGVAQCWTCCPAEMRFSLLRLFLELILLLFRSSWKLFLSKANSFS